MKLKDISEFEKGEIAHQWMTGIDYEVKDFTFTVKRNKRVIEFSKCINLDTGREVIITWHKNKNFI